MDSKEIGNTLFVFNPDFSGVVKITRDGQTIEVPGLQLVEFVVTTYLKSRQKNS
jgi:hypothetical protein